MKPQQVVSEADAVSGSIPWGTILVIAAVVLVIVLAVVLFVWWRKKKRSAPARPAPGASLRDRLPRIYRPFYRKIPLAARHYPTVIVAGEAGVGKSRLIDSRVDWRGQSNQFHPSSTDDSLLQLYLGPGVVVQELSAPLLRNVSSDAENALTGLWRRLGRRPATAIVVMDGRALSIATPQAQTELAQLVRGKLDLIADHGRRQVTVRLCLSHMDLIDGFPEFARLLRRRGHQLRIETGDKSSNLGHVLDPFDNHLSLALTTCTSDEFRDIVSFYRGSPALFGSLNPFLYTLGGGDDPYASAYTVEGVYLTSASPDDHVGDPFTVDRSTVAADIARENRRRYAISGAIVGATAALLFALLGWHGSRVESAEQAVSAFAAAARQKGATPQMIAASQKEAGAAIARMDSSEVLWLSHSFVSRKNDVRADYATTIRDTYLLPEAAKTTERGRLLLAASLIYAAENSSLGRLITKDPSSWTDELGVSKEVILDYVHASAEPWSGTLQLPDDLSGSDGGVPREWSEFLLRLQRILASDRISPAQLESLKKEVDDKLALSSSARYDLLSLIATLVAEDATLASKLAPLLEVQPASEWVSENYDSLVAVSALIKQASFAGLATDLNDWTLEDLLAELGNVAPAPEPAASGQGSGSGTQAGSSAQAGAGGQATTGSAQTGDQATGSAQAGSSAASQGTGQDTAGTAQSTAAAQGTAAPAAYTFVLSDRTVVIGVADWDELLMRSSAGLLIDRFIKAVSGSNRSPFFSSQAFYPAAGAMRGTMQGPSVVIPGLYTRQAFADNVLPVLTAMAGDLSGLVLSDKDRGNLKSFTLASVNEYATEYGQELDNYYNSFAFAPLSLDELVFELRAMSTTTSWFVTFLRAVADNADLGLPGEGPFFDPMAGSVEPFLPIVAVMAESKGKYPQLDPYLTILGDLATTLSGSGASGSGGSGGSADSGEEGLELSPAGELAMEALSGKDKPLPQTRAWLATAAIEPAYQTPFLAPVERAYQLGYMDIERAVAAAWQSEIYEPLQPLLEKYPFNRKASDEVAISDLEDWFTPAKGRFWQNFATYIEPVAVQRKGQWRMRSPIAAPRGMLPLVNSAAAMSAALWDAKGNPQALSVAVTPQPLPTTKVSGRVATLGFVKTGAAAVYGFNQKPQAQALAVEWWDQGTSSVGVQLRAPDIDGSELRSVDMVDSPWSFYRLLDKAAISRSLAATWTVPVATRQTLDITFTLGADPRDVFALTN